MTALAGDSAAKLARTDRYGDPLPPRALLRLGTVRLRAAPVRLAFLPGDRQLVSVSGERENEGHVWDIDTGRKIRHLHMGEDYLAGSALTLDGRTAALAYTDHKTATLLFLDTVSGEEIRRHAMPAHKIISTLAFTPDGRTLIGSCEDHTIRLWDAATGRERGRLKGHQGGVVTVMVSPDGQTIASGGWDRALRLWDAKSGEERHKMEGLPGQVWSLAFAPDGKTLASAGQKDKTIRLWDVKTGKLRRQLEGHRNAPRGLAFSPDGKLLASGMIYHDENSIRLWDVGTGRPLRRLEGNYWTTHCIAFSSDGKMLAASSGDQAIHLWDTATGKAFRPRGEHQSWVLSVAYSPDGRLLATGSRDERIRFWDASTGALVRTFAGHREGVLSTVFAADGKILATSGGDNLVRLRDTASGKELRSFDVAQGRSPANTCLAAFSPTGDIVATTRAGAGQAVLLWSARTGELLRRLAHPTDVHCLSFSPDGRFLATGGGDITRTGTGTVHLWETATGREARHWSPSVSRFESVAFTADGKMLAAASYPSPIFLWDTVSGEQRQRLILPEPTHTSTLAFSPDGKTLATSLENIVGGDSEDYAVCLWETFTGKERCRFLGHQTMIFALAFSPDSRRLASGSMDTTVLVWDATGGPATDEGEISAERVRSGWDDLASPDVGKAFDAIGLLTAAPQHAIPMLKDKLQPAPAPLDPEQMARLLADLDRDEFTVRQKAMTSLRQMDERAEPGLRAALKGEVSLEMHKRIEELLEGVRASAASPEHLRPLRAVEVLEHVGTPEAEKVLRTLANGAAEARLTREAKAAQERLQRRHPPRP